MCRVFSSAFRIVFLAVLTVFGVSAQAAFKAVLQGQSASSSTWTTSGLQGWKELDYVPCRVYLTGGPASNKVITVEFQHIQGRIPAIQNLSGFTNSGNVEVLSAPVLSAPASSNYWAYTFTVNVRDGQAGWVSFKARLAAGSHELSTSGMTLRGSPALGTLTICRPSKKSGLPDLKLVKTGPAQAEPGEVITYSLSYSNKASANCPATGVQINDILPPQVTLIAASLPAKTEVVGNMLFIDLGNLAVKASGRLTYSVQVKANVANGIEFNNSAEIVSAEEECKPSDNYSCVVTRVAFNRPPVANADSYSTGEDVLLQVTAPGVLGNDTDPDGGSLTAALLTGPTHGTLTFNVNGSFEYRPANNFHGTDTFTYVARDSKTSSAPATVTITVTPINDAPVALDDSYTTERNTQLTISAPGVLMNDSDIDGSSLTAVRVTNPANGTLVFNANGSFAYRPNPGFLGTDSFTYKATDGNKSSTAATVTIVVTPGNAAPSAASDSYTVHEDAALTGNVLSNDTDTDGDTLRATLLSGVSHGTLTLNPNGTFAYQPIANFNGADAFSYRANDGEAESAVVTVSIQVLPVNDPPSFTLGLRLLLQRNANHQFHPGHARDISAGPADEAGQTLAFTVTVDNASLFAVPPSISADGTLDFTPGVDVYGTVVVTVVLKDDGGTERGGSDTSVSRTFTVVINSPPTARIALPTNGSVFVAKMNITVVAEASDVDGQIAHVDLLQGTNVLARTLQAPYFHVINSALAGAYQFGAVATDDLGDTGEATPVNVTVLEFVPHAAGPFHLNRQTGLFEQTVRVTNPTPEAFAGIRLWIKDVRPQVAVWNKTGQTEGIPYVEANSFIPAGGQVDILVTYHAPDVRVPPEPVFEAVPILVSERGPLAESTTRIMRCERQSNGRFRLEFTATRGKMHCVQFSDDLRHWQTAPGAVGTEPSMTWIDPQAAATRYYRVVVLP